MAIETALAPREGLRVPTYGCEALVPSNPFYYVATLTALRLLNYIRCMELINTLLCATYSTMLCVTRIVICIPVLACQLLQKHVSEYAINHLLTINTLQ